MLFGDFAESQLKDLKEVVDEEGSTEDYGYLSDSDLEDDEDERVSSLEALPFNTLEVSGEGDACEHREERLERGKIVKIPDMAFVT